jgi:hypothetical protein
MVQLLYFICEIMIGESNYFGETAAKQEKLVKRNETENTGDLI